MKKIIITALIIGYATNAWAHGHRHHRLHPMVSGLGHGLVHMLHSMGKPRAWCGWYMRQVMGVDDESYNLARNWSHWGRAAAGPDSGVVVVWSHHVGQIVGHCGNGWLVNSGNDGHAVRTRCRSIAGAIAFREP